MAACQSEVSMTIGNFACKKIAANSIAIAKPTRTVSPGTGGNAAPQHNHEKHYDAKAAECYDAGGAMQCAALQDRFGGECLQDCARNDMAIRNIKPIAELNRCCADNDLFVLKLFQRGKIAAQYVHIGDRRQRIAHRC